MILKNIEFKKRIKDNNYDNLYLFYGEEDYLKDYNINLLKKNLLKNDSMNLNYIQYDEFPDKDELLDNVESVPILSDKKIILFNSLTLIGAGVKKENKDLISAILSDIPEYTVIIIKEKEISKTSALFKLIDKNGIIQECGSLTPSELNTFASAQFIKHKKTVQPDALKYLLTVSFGTIYSLINEIDKICAYMGDETNITKDIVDMLVKRPVEDKVFELFDLIINKNKKKAYMVLEDLKYLKNQHPAGQIFSILCDNFINMYLSIQNYHEKISNNDIAAFLGMPPKRAFVVGKYISSGKNIPIKRLKNLIGVIADMDFKIKNGLTDPYYAIEEIIAVF